MVAVNSLPLPGSLASEILPFISSHNCLHIASPSPVPPYSRVVDASTCEKGVNNCCCFASVMPIPESFTFIFSIRSWSVFSIDALTTTSPWLVNLTALLIKLVTTWRMRPGSPIKCEGSKETKSKIISMPFSCAVKACASAISPIKSRALKCICSSSTLPASTLEKSKISLITPSKE